MPIQIKKNIDKSMYAEVCRCFVVGARVIVFATGGGKRENCEKRKRPTDFRGVVHQIPGVTLVESAGRDALGGVNDASAAHGHDEVDIFLAAELNCLFYRSDLGIGFNAAEPKQPALESAGFPDTVQAFP